MAARIIRSLALCALASAAALDVTPQQFHIAFAGLGGMRVSYKTQNDTSSLCVYGLQPANLNQSATGTSKSYMPDHGFHHTVKLTGLVPGSKYYYMCGDAATKSAVFSFVAAPAPAPGGTVRALVFGDMGYLGSKERGATIGIGGLETNWSATLSRELMEAGKINQTYDVVFHTGDIGYQDDSFGYADALLNFTYESTLDGYMGWLQNVSASIPYMVSVGNHESECHSPACILDVNDLGLHLNNFSAFNSRWAMPWQESQGVLNMWYSWDVGNVHFVSINTETDWAGAEEENTGDGHFAFLPAGHFAPNGTYFNWLRQDLMAAAKSSRWILAGGHRPFEDFNHTQLGALFKAAGVAMYFAGHGHSYSRYDVSAWGDGVVHIMAGGAGCDEMPFPADQLVGSGDEVRITEDGPAAKAQCEAWCTSPEVVAAMSKPHAAVSSTGNIAYRSSNEHTQPRHDPCKYCTGAPGAVPPLVTSAKMALGWLQATDDQIVFKLLRAPDGAVLDSVTIQHA